MYFNKKLQNILGKDNVIFNKIDQKKFLYDYRNQYQGNARAIVQPDSVEKVSEIVSLCSAFRVSIVPQGGNTSLCGGATPDCSGQSIVISMNKLNHIRSVDLVNNSVIVESGCTLHFLRKNMASLNRLFPMKLISEQSCTVGGNLATNSGGMEVLHYGSMRALTFGLEVVTPDGRIINGLKELRKDNTGYSIKDLYIGSEGTLGIITAASLRLFHVPNCAITIVACINSIRDALHILDELNGKTVFFATKFELIDNACLKLLLQSDVNVDYMLIEDLLQGNWCILIELSTFQTGMEKTLKVFIKNLRDTLSKICNIRIITNNTIVSDKLWNLREKIPTAEKLSKYHFLKNDISLPLSKLEFFLEETSCEIYMKFPQAKIFVFGHLGDGNLHYNVGLNDKNYSKGLIKRIINENVNKYNGSISAEHGIGQNKIDELERYKNPVELSIMRLVKKSLDPFNIMNPGKLMKL